MSEIPKAKIHTLMLDNRKKLVLTGVEDVNGFNEESVSAKTSCGTLIIKGEGLHIDRLCLETGDMSIDGKINALQYLGSDVSRSKLSKLFK
ncbi:MAG: sporulation protein YabP [Clostridiales bacterium]|nr:sporulation protein YabP [Clostridiales bacterium]